MLFFVEKIKVSDIIEEFIYEIRIRNYSEKTIKGVKNNLINFEDYLQINGKFFVDEIDRMDIKRFINSYQEKGSKATYINGKLNAISILFSYLVEEEAMTPAENPSKNIKRLIKDKPKIIVFTNEEVKKLINVNGTSSYMEIRDKLIIMLLADTGMRVAELCGIEIKNVTDSQIIIHGKGRKQRSVYISPIINKFLFKYFRKKKEYFNKKDYEEDKRYLFASYRGNQLTIEAVERVVRLAGKRTKVRPEVRCSPHTLRHWWAVYQLNSGQDLYTISKLLGHASLSITQIYLQSISDDSIVEKGVKTAPLMNL